MSTRTFHFTKKKLADLVASDKQIEFTDAEEKTLKVIVYPSGTKRYFARVKLEGKSYTKKLGTYPYLPLPIARQDAREHRTQIESGEIHGSTLMKFSEFVETIYLPYALQYKRSASSDMSKMSNHLLPLFGNRPIGRIGRLDISDYHIKIKEKLSPATANRHLSLLKKVFRMATQHGIIKLSPAGGIPAFPENNRRDRVLSVAEANAFLTVASNPISTNREQDVDLLCLLLWTGMRVSEALTLKHSQVDADSSSFWLPDTKTGHPRRIYCSSKAKDIIQRRLRATPTGYLFPNVKGDGPMARPTKCFRRVCKEAGIPTGSRDNPNGLRIHDIRRSAASFSTNAPKGDIYATAALLGHQDLSTTRRYAFVDQASLQQSADNIVEAILD